MARSLNTKLLIGEKLDCAVQVMLLRRKFTL